MMKSILCVMGTRPEAIKMAPVILSLKDRPWARCRVLLTGQHRDLVGPILDTFGIEPDLELDSMKPGQTLADLTSSMLTAVHDALTRERPDFVLAQGDTTSVLVTALACLYHKVPFGHVEAGLRTGQLHSPFPEEANRTIATRLAALHFAPTDRARLNLIREGVSPPTVHLTGNTVIDALQWTARQGDSFVLEPDLGRRLILITAHRRESFGEPIRQICRAVLELHRRFADIEFLWPVHPNPEVRDVVHQQLRDLPRVRLSPPLKYRAFVAAMQRSALILTDSGGVQEEAPSLGKPVLVLRDSTERPEAVESGVARLVGWSTANIVAETSRLLVDRQAYEMMARARNPFGDGRAALRIVGAVAGFLGMTEETRLAG